MLDKSSGKPLYAQICEILAEEIKSGVYDAAGKLPGERRLKERFGVERNTVRQSIDNLSKLGLVAKIPGYGTKIAGLGNEGKYGYAQICEMLEREIKSGLYDAPGKLPGERRLQERFGAERETVRTAVKILADKKIVAKVPGYGTKIAKTNQFGPDGKNILFVTKKDYLSGKNGEYFNLQLLEKFIKAFLVSGFNINFTAAGDRFNLAETAKNARAAAVIFEGCNKDSLYAKAKSLNIPCVSVNHYTSMLTSITSNNFDAAYDVAKTLVEAGHKNIAFVTGRDDCRTTAERLGGVQSYYAEHKLHLDKKYVISGRWHFASGYEAGEKILSMPPDERPTAVFAFNDDMAFGCLSCFENHKIHVPENISLAGFDRSEKYAALYRPITTVDSNIDAIADCAYWYLKSRIENTAPAACFKIQVDTSIIDNGTVKKTN
ncbi:MAG: GntR family transcriptional regulator [Oscillospiraceae bacterium]|nr:GntR family transcriptional regulator [Oscillospiraceae bacterium]